MKRTTIMLTIVAALVLPAVLSNCNIIKTKVVDLVVNVEAFWEFADTSASEVFTSTDRIAIAGEIDAALADEGYTRADIDTITVMGVAVGVTGFSHTHDWKISGAIEIERVGGASDTIVAYDSLSVKNSLGRKIPVKLEPGGVAILQQALADYLAGANPEIIYRVLNGDVDPNPSASDKIAFEWKVWATFQVTVQEGVDVPDPF